MCNASFAFSTYLYFVTNMNIISVVLLLYCFRISSQLSIKSDNHYVAAVVEFDGSSSENQWKDYFNLISEASELDVDLIVFPEGKNDITKLIKVPLYGKLKNNPVPAMRPHLYDEALVLMSEAAKKYNMYVVVNLYEEVDCGVDNSENCTEPNTYVFNTDVVFDRSGAVIARYRKTNIYNEPNVTASFDTGVTTFETDFGVQFGIVICFDLLNNSPLTQLASQGVDNVIASSYWVNELPFLTAVQTHASLAYGLDINLLVSGYDAVTGHASGSGIYSGKNGTVISFITGVPSTKLLVAKVPKVPGKSAGPGSIKQAPSYFDGLHLLQDSSLPAHISQLLVEGNQSILLSFNDITCRFNITMKGRGGEKSYKYRAGAFSGVRAIEDTALVGVRDCGIFFCADESIDTCGSRYLPYIDNATSFFEELTIEATVPTSKITPSGTSDSTFYPTSLDIYMLPLEPNDFEYTLTNNGTTSIHRLKLKKIDTKLYTFGFWGRNFGADGGKVTPRYKEMTPEDVKKSVEEEMEKVLKEITAAHEKIVGNIMI